MKTLTTINWILIGLYGILIIYLIGATSNPNNDAAGRGMISGFIFFLLIFIGGLTFLNLRPSRTAKIIASALGGVPLLFISATLTTEARVVNKREKAVVTQATASTLTNDTAAAKLAVLDFLHWYQVNFQLINQIHLVDQQPGKPYSINARNAERYLIYLKSSEMLTDHYLNEWRTYFKERQAGFQLTHQNEGTPTGFEYDLVMLTLTQDVATQMSALKSLKINSVKVHTNRASVKFFLVEDYEFRLVKQHNRWVINEILNLSAE